MIYLLILLWYVWKSFMVKSVVNTDISWNNFVLSFVLNAFYLGRSPSIPNESQVVRRWLLVVVGGSTLMLPIAYFHFKSSLKRLNLYVWSVYKKFVNIYYTECFLSTKNKYSTKNWRGYCMAYFRKKKSYKHMP